MASEVKLKELRKEFEFAAKAFEDLDAEKVSLQEQCDDWHQKCDEVSSILDSANEEIASLKLELEKAYEEIDLVTHKL